MILVAYIKIPEEIAGKCILIKDILLLSLKLISFHEQEGTKKAKLMFKRNCVAYVE